MTIGERIKRLRQEKDWTQAELAENLHVHQKQVSADERSVNTPSTDILVKLAEIFGVTLDYLAFESNGQPARFNIQDRELLRRFEAVDRLPAPSRALARPPRDSDRV